MVNVVHVMPTLLASFMASLVECVEALTVVLAVGAVRGWKSALGGTAGALLTLLLLMLSLGRSLALIPIFALQVGVGLLLLLFGLRWLRKAILRASGVIPLHDEEQAFAKASATLRLSLAADGRRFDQVAFVSAYKIVMLEGIEVVFIVMALGSGFGLLVPAAIGAIAALICVMLLGFAVHRPLSRIPENTLKFAVGILLSAFGNFWLGEGIGIAWPGADRSLPALVAAYLGIGCATVMVFRRRSVPATISRPVSTPPRRTLLARMFAALMALFIDDSLLAPGTVIWVALCALALHWLPLSALAQAAGFSGGLIAILAVSGARGARIYQGPAIVKR
jgi:Ca2+/H+ antiporter, TMEM165/GDT1 family